MVGQVQSSFDSVLSLAKKQLKDHGIENCTLDARLLLQHACNLTHEELISRYNEQIPIDQFALYQNYVNRRINFEPISQIIGKKEFYGREFKVSKDVLTPRPDSETLIETCISLFTDKSKDLRILDLGVGTGCLILTLLAQYPNATGIGVDISKEALAIAEFNAKNLLLSSKVKFILNNWAENIEGKFDIIISNPPYIKNEDLSKLDKDVALYDPHQALFGGNDGLECYRLIAPYMSKLLNETGFAIFECGQNQHDEITNIFKLNNLNLHSYKQDLNGTIRSITFNLNKEHL